MNKKGFTLVELLAVISILALLALLTSTAVTKLVSDSKEELSETQIQLIKAAAESWGADNLMNLPEAGECKYLTLGNLKEYGLLDSNITDPKTNNKISDDLKIKISSELTKYNTIKTTYEVGVTDIEGCAKALNPVCTYDILSEKSTGDEVICGTEEFYVISNDGTNIRMLAKYNVNENGVQEKDTAFVTTYQSPENNTYEYEGSKIEGLVNDYVSNLGIESATGDLITLNELVNLGCDSQTDGGTCTSSSYTWVYSTSYWEKQGGYSEVAAMAGPMYINANGSKNFADWNFSAIYEYGLRPVVVVSKN